MLGDHDTVGHQRDELELPEAQPRVHLLLRRPSESRLDPCRVPATNISTDLTIAANGPKIREPT